MQKTIQKIFRCSNQDCVAVIFDDEKMAGISGNKFSSYHDRFRLDLDNYQTIDGLWVESNDTIKCVNEINNIYPDTDNKEKHVLRIFPDGDVDREYKKYIAPEELKTLLYL